MLLLLNGNEQISPRILFRALLAERVQFFQYLRSVLVQTRRRPTDSAWRTRELDWNSNCLDFTLRGMGLVLEKLQAL